MVNGWQVGTHKNFLGLDCETSIVFASVDDVIGWSEFLQQLASLIPLRKQTIDSLYRGDLLKQTNKQTKKHS